MYQSSVVINVTGVSDKKERAMMSTGGSHLSGRYVSSSSKALDSASKVQNRPKSTLKGQVKGGATPLKTQAGISSSGYHDSSSKLYSPYQVNNIYQDYAPVIKRRPESNMKPRSKKEITFNGPDWQSQHSRSSSKMEYREILLTEETNGHPVGQEIERFNPKQGSKKALITHSEQKALYESKNHETPSHAYFNNHMDSPQLQSVMLRGGKLPIRQDNWTAQVQAIKDTVGTKANFVKRIQIEQAIELPPQITTIGSQRTRQTEQIIKQTYSFNPQYQPSFNVQKPSPHNLPSYAQGDHDEVSKDDLSFFNLPKTSTQAAQEVQRIFQRQRPSNHRNGERSESPHLRTSQSPLSKSKSARQLAQTPLMIGVKNQNINNQRAPPELLSVDIRSSREDEEEEVESIDRQQEIQVRRMFVMSEKPMDRPSPTKRLLNGYQSQYPLVHQTTNGATSYLVDGKILIQQTTPASSEQSSHTRNKESTLQLNISPKHKIYSQQQLSQPRDHHHYIMSEEDVFERDEDDFIDLAAPSDSHLPAMTYNEQPESPILQIDRGSMISPSYLNPDIISDGILAMEHNNESYFQSDITPPSLQQQQQRTLQIDRMLDFMNREEERLGTFAQLITMGQLIELQAKIYQSPKIELDYTDLMQILDPAKRERPRLFAYQLHMTLLIANTLVKLLQTSSSLTSQFTMQKFGAKLRTVYTNAHQSFLLLIDLLTPILATLTLTPKELQLLLHLKRSVTKRLKRLKHDAVGKTSTLKRQQRLQQLRQNIEMSMSSIKHICKALRNPSGNVIGAQLSSGASTVESIQGELLYRISEVLLEICRNSAHEESRISEIERKIVVSQIEITEDIRRSKPPIQGLISPNGSKQGEFTFKKGRSSSKKRSSSPRSQKSSSSVRGGEKPNKREKVTLKPITVKKPAQSSVNSQKKSIITHYASARSQSPALSDNQSFIGDEHNISIRSFKSNKSQERPKPKTSPFKKKLPNPSSLPETVAFILQNSVEALPSTGGVTNINNTINIYNTNNTNVLGQPQTASVQNLKQPYEQSKISILQTGQTLNGSVSQRVTTAKKAPLKSGNSTGKGTTMLKSTMKKSPGSKKTAFKRSEYQTATFTASVEHIPQTKQHPLFKSSNVKSPSKAAEQPIKINLTGKDDQQSQKKKHNLQIIDQHHSSIQDFSSQNSERVSPSKHKFVSTHYKSNEIPHSKGEDIVDLAQEGEDEDVQVYKVSQHFLKQYKPMIQSKSSKYNVVLQQGYQPIGQSHQAKEVVISKKKVGASHGTDAAASQINNSKHMTSFQSHYSYSSVQKQPEPMLLKTSPPSLKSSLALPASSPVTKNVQLICDGGNLQILNQPIEGPVRMIDLDPKTKLTQLKPKHLLNNNSLAGSSASKLESKFEVVVEDTDTFREEECRLDKLLDKMQQPEAEQTVQASNIISVFLSDEGGNNSSRLLDDSRLQNLSPCSGSPGSASSKNKVPKELHFGELIEKSFGMSSFDLKREMEILRKVDEEVTTVKFKQRHLEDFELAKEEVSSSHEQEQDEHPIEEVAEASANQVQTDLIVAKTSKSQKMEAEFLRLKSQVTIPYLPPLRQLDDRPVYTLVLDLDETLIHLECDEDANNQDDDEQNEDSIYYLIRPGAIRFLTELSKYYEIVIFTAAMPDYADWIMDNVDRFGVVKHRLYRQHTSPHEDYAIKDLRLLGRPLERTIIIDNLAENFLHTTPDNGIWVESWYDDMDDNVLELLTPFLKDIVMSGRVPDVRALLNKNMKEKVLYKCLEEGKEIPKIDELLQIE